VDNKVEGKAEDTPVDRVDLGKADSDKAGEWWHNPLGLFQSVRERKSEREV
jgi:hypothetical protein